MIKKIMYTLLGLSILTPTWTLFSYSELSFLGGLKVPVMTISFIAWLLLGAHIGESLRVYHDFQSFRKKSLNQMQEEVLKALETIKNKVDNDAR